MPSAVRALEDLDRLGVTRRFMKTMASAVTSKSSCTTGTRNDATAQPDPRSRGRRAVGVPAERRHPRRRPLPIRCVITRLIRNRTPATFPPRRAACCSSRARPAGSRTCTSSSRSATASARLSARIDEPRRPGTTVRARWTVSATESVTQLKKTGARTPVGRPPRHRASIRTRRRGTSTTFYDELAAKRPPSWKQDRRPVGRVRDGMILRESNVAELPVHYDELADVLIDPKHPPVARHAQPVLLGRAHGARAGEAWRARRARVPRRDRRRAGGAVLPGVLLGVVPPGGAFAISARLHRGVAQDDGRPPARHRDRDLDGAQRLREAARSAPRPRRADGGRRGDEAGRARSAWRSTPIGELLQVAARGARRGELLAAAQRSAAAHQADADQAGQGAARGHHRAGRAEPRRAELSVSAARSSCSTSRSWRWRRWSGSR